MAKHLVNLRKNDITLFDKIAKKKKKLKTCK